uniref:Uncharacterized protein n=1 Tax=Oryza nivara TaxID=4536 RepID=A0A0E0INA3_ORYNI
MDVGVVVVMRTRSRRPPTRSYAPSPPPLPQRSTADDWMGIDPLSSFPCKLLFAESGQGYVVEDILTSPDQLQPGSK